MKIVQQVFQSIIDSIVDGIRVSKNLFPTIICIVIILKILQELNLVRYVALPLEPLMGLMGLPAELGIVWAVAILNSVYPALVILPSVLLTIPALTVEQATVLGVIILIAHSLILETRVAGQCGLSMRFQFFLRFFTAVIAGILLHWLCSFFNIWQEEARILLLQPEAVTTWTAWAINEIWNLLQIFVIVCAVMLFTRTINHFKISYYFGLLLAPIMRLVGISQAGTNVIVVGLSIGILYGGGIIIKESNDGTLSKADSFAAMSLMSIAHALIEDTLLLMLIGGSLWGLLVFRFVIAVLICIIIKQVYTRKNPEITSDCKCN